MATPLNVNGPKRVTFAEGTKLGRPSLPEPKAPSIETASQEQKTTPKALESSFIRIGAGLSLTIAGGIGSILTSPLIILTKGTFLGLDQLTAIGRISAISEATKEKSLNLSSLGSIAAVQIGLSLLLRPQEQVSKPTSEYLPEESILNYEDIPTESVEDQSKSSPKSSVKDTSTREDIPERSLEHTLTREDILTEDKSKSPPKREINGKPIESITPDEIKRWKPDQITQLKNVDLSHFSEAQMQSLDVSKLLVSVANNYVTRKGVEKLTNAQVKDLHDMLSTTSFSGKEILKEALIKRG